MLSHFRCATTAKSARPCKGIHAQKLYRPFPGQKDAYPHLQAVLSRPINWDLIRTQYDEMVKFATALRLGTAETEAILRRFTRTSVQHPTYAALAELGKVIKTIFLCSYLRDPAVRREVHEGLQVVENWNSANNFIHYGKGGEIATNRLDDQEVSVLCMTLVQNALCFVNTLMIQRVLAEPAWMERMSPEDLRGLTPLIYAHVNPYGPELENVSPAATATYPDSIVFSAMFFGTLRPFRCCD